MISGFIVWTRKFVYKTDDVRTKQKKMKNKLLFRFLIGQHQALQNYEFHFFHTQVECALKCAFKMVLTSGDMRISDPIGYYTCPIFCRIIAEHSGNIYSLPEMTIPSNSPNYYL